MRNNRSHLAIAKAALLREGLRQASQLQVSAQAQALYATIIAEAWPRGSRWCTKIAQQTLANRLGCSIASIRRWLAELVPELVEQHTGRARTISLYVICCPLTHERSDPPPVQGPPFKDDRSEPSPARPSSGDQYLSQETPWWSDAASREECITFARRLFPRPDHSTPAR